MKNTIFAFALLALPMFAYAPRADACACCSEQGERIESISKLDGYQKTELEKVRFGKKARLYSTAAGAAGIQGIQGLTDPTDAYDITQSRVGDRWTFTLKDSKGRTGTLAFTLPTHVESFFVDQQDGKANTDPVLYKEWRINAPVTATGIFAPAGSAGSSGAPILRVVLQGRGNACTSADQFTSFSLIASGPSARFTFFGPLAAPAP